MVTSKDRIELALRAGMIAKSALRLTDSFMTKRLATSIKGDIVAMVRDLDAKISQLPDE